MLWFVVFLAVLICFTEAAPGCPAAPPTPGDRRPDRTRLRVISFNVEWLFCGCDGRGPWNGPEEAQQHLEEVGDVVATLRPDILAVQEVQNCDMLARLGDYLRSRHGMPDYRPYLVPGTDTATGQNVGLLSLVDPFVNVVRSTNRVEFPVPGSRCGTTVGNSAISKHFVSRFNINGMNVAILGVHFVAFPMRTDRCLQREAQASVLRGLINERLAAGDQVIALGDLNDYSDRVLDFPDNNVPVSQVMRIIRDGLPAGMAGANSSENRISLRPAEEAAPRFFEQLATIEWASRYTAAYSVTRLSAIDHILLTEPLWQRVVGTSIYHGYPRETVSDHWPVVVDLNTPLDWAKTKDVSTA
jgi:endonuclease/exonuclease/phosphatase family metal-dependent hydrolase